MTLNDWLTLLDQGIWDSDFLTDFACWMRDDVDDPISADCLIWLRDSGRQPGVSSARGNRFWIEHRNRIVAVLPAHLPQEIFDLLSRDGTDSPPMMSGLWYSPPHKALTAVLYAWRRLFKEQRSSVSKFPADWDKT